MGTPNWQEPVDEISKLSTVQSSHITQSDALVDRVVFKRKPVIFQSLSESGIIRQLSHVNSIKDNSSQTSLYFRASHQLESGNQTVRLVSETPPSQSTAFIKCCSVIDNLQIKSIKQNKIPTEYSAEVNNSQNIKHKFRLGQKFAIISFLNLLIFSLIFNVSSGQVVIAKKVKFSPQIVIEILNT